MSWHTVAKPIAVVLTAEQQYAIRELALYAQMLEEQTDFSENRTIDDGYLEDGNTAFLTIDALNEVASILDNKENN